jgi:FkbM family methyltransferase
MSSADEPVAAYWRFISSICPSLSQDDLASLTTELEDVVWEEPETSLDLNNFAVMALVEAELGDDPDLRAMNLDIALQALNAGVEQQPAHPLCIAHLVLVRAMVGDTQAAVEMAYSQLLALMHPAQVVEISIEPGLVYLPPDLTPAIARPEGFQHILSVADGYGQAMRLLSIAISYGQLVFYGNQGMRFLSFATHLMPQSTSLNLKLGLASGMAQQWEGLLFLHRAQQNGLANYSAPMQGLYLAYRKLGQPYLAAHWLAEGHKTADSLVNTPQWLWTTLPPDSPFTYVPFDDGLVMAVEPNLRSIVTTVLIGEGDWFEAEMEFWRDRLQPGMTVIDVGANVGVYTFSAAHRVGKTGKVIAIEPFSGCVSCLQETCRINQLEWVEVHGAAASDRPGKLRLSIHEASELNEVLADDEIPKTGKIEEVPCITLDSLIEEEHLTQVDWLKIDAEGHEMKVLEGSDRLLQEFHPAILYENIAGTSASNTPVAEYLLSKGYQLFRYQPYLKSLLPVENISELQTSLNVIALPSTS